MALLEVEQLKVSFTVGGQTLDAVTELEFQLSEGDTLCIVGESGCGKSVTAGAIMRLLPKGSGRASGRILFQGRDLLSLSDDEMRRVRAGEISMIFQEHSSALNPVHTVEHQLIEGIRSRNAVRGIKTQRREAHKESLSILTRMSIPSPERRLRQFPHELSGGMRQRILIGMAVTKKPALLIADEPTTALDVTIQAQILELIKDLKRSYNTSILFITHDMGVVADIADQVLVMYAGQMVEYGNVFEIFRNPSHPYTVGLLRSIPEIDDESRRLFTIDGAVPELWERAEGCRFRDRCRERSSLCDRNPPVVDFEGKKVRCWQYAQSEEAQNGHGC